MPFGNDAWRKAEVYRFSYRTAWPGFRLGVGAFFVAWGVESVWKLATGKGGHHGHDGHGHDHHGHHEVAASTPWTKKVGEPPVLSED
eukprot:CAMPEP_0114519774 /NCGR_PEP_ID=MMETSP0109-20121206/19199_1 /TAXON_ID=29199 /ORGANISM="Chlorarachnion reptans, Strain CCCM449" /LENGTH=86 /DNA_ID=CAMNT_0001700569 /DNA_START=73 /DNA_END=333 /DNA_ORIENTATION=-